MEIILKEILIDLKVMLRRWNLVIFLVFLGFIVVMSRNNGEAAFGFIILMFSMWSCQTMKPKINVLHYILPGEAKNRIFRILMKSFCVFLINITWYVLAIIIRVSLSDYRFGNELKTMFCEVLPFFITYVAMNMNSGYDYSKSIDKDRIRKNKAKNFLSMFVMVVPIFNVNLLSDMVKGTGVIVLTVSAYFCAVLVLYWQISILAHTNLGYDNIRKVEKIFS